MSKVLLISPAPLFYPKTLNTIIPKLTMIAITICLFYTLNFCEALEKNTPNSTTERKLQQLKRLTVVKEVITMVKLSRVWMKTSAEESLANS